jgi:hypothetical protein
MKPASLHLLKQELSHRTPAEVEAICLRLARYKTENKELLTYLLLESDDEESYIAHIKQSIDEQLESINEENIYYAKKGLQKVNRYLTKWIRYSGIRATEVELRIYFCQRILQTGFPIEGSKILINLYHRQLERARKAIDGLHEDLQYDFLRELDALEIG